MTGPFDGRVVAVSGAAGGGIGTAMVEALSAAGATVVANARRADQLTCLQDLAGRVVPMAADVSDRDRVEAALSGTGLHVDSLVHCAAPDYEHMPTDMYEDDTWAAEIATILTGALNRVRAAIPNMKRAGFGRIVLIGSSAARQGTLGRGVGYATAKAGLVGMCRQLALELGPYGITVNCIEPGQIDTPRIRRGGRRTQASLDRRAAALPVRRVGIPQDIAGAVMFLLDHAAGYVTGTTLALNGGAHLASAATMKATRSTSTCSSLRHSRTRFLPSVFGSFATYIRLGRHQHRSSSSTPRSLIVPRRSVLVSV